MDFNKVINGIAKYMDKEIFTKMNGWQEMVARIAMARVINNSATLRKWLSNNAFIRTFAVIDESGNVDVEGLINDIRGYIRSKGYLEVTHPIFGAFKFTEADVDKLRLAIMEG